MIRNKKIMFITAPPGAGKDRLTKIISGMHLRVRMITTSQALLEYGKKNNCWEEIASFQKKSQKVPDQITIPAITEMIRDMKDDPSFDVILINGFPRSPSQIDAIVNMTEFEPKDFFVIQINRSFERCSRNISTSADRSDRLDGDTDIPKRFQDYMENVYPYINLLESHGAKVLSTGDIEELDDIVPQIIEYFHLDKLISLPDHVFPLGLSVLGGRR